MYKATFRNITFFWNSPQYCSPSKCYNMQSSKGCFRALLSMACSKNLFKLLWLGKKSLFTYWLASIPLVQCTVVVSKNTLENLLLFFSRGWKERERERRKNKSTTESSHAGLHRRLSVPSIYSYSRQKLQKANTYNVHYYSVKNIKRSTTN